jgi:hypothetical protein
VAAICVFALVSATIAALAVAVLVNVGQPDGPDVPLATGVLTALAIGWLVSLGRLRKRVWPRALARPPERAGPIRPGWVLFRRRRRPRWRPYRITYPDPDQKPELLPGIKRPRTELTLADIRQAQYLPREDRDVLVDGSVFNGGRRAVGAPITRLADIERSIGDVLYQLDRTVGDHALTRDQIVSVRVAGLRASAWLSGRADETDVLRRDPLSDQEVADGIDRYAALATAARDLLDGHAQASTVLLARDRLGALLGRVAPDETAR